MFSPDSQMIQECLEQEFGDMRYLSPALCGNCTLETFAVQGDIQVGELICDTMAKAEGASSLKFALSTEQVFMYIMMHSVAAKRLEVVDRLSVHERVAVR